MNIQVLKTAWRRMKKPSRQTMQTLEASGAKVDFWPDYAPRRLSHSPDRQQWERVTRTLTAQIGKEVA